VADDRPALGEQVDEPARDDADLMDLQDGADLQRIRNGGGIRASA
jgi:hypothetical protein